MAVTKATFPGILISIQEQAGLIHSWHQYCLWPMVCSEFSQCGSRHCAHGMI